MLLRISLACLLAIAPNVRASDQHNNNRPGIPLKLTKQQYEESAPMPDLLQTNGQLTYVYALKEPEADQLVPLKQCLVNIFEIGKAVVQPECGNMIGPILRKTLLPYKCFLHSDPLDYQLVTTVIDRLEIEDDLHIIFFTVKDNIECSINLGRTSLDKADDGVTEKRYQFDVLKNEL